VTEKPRIWTFAVPGDPVPWSVWIKRSAPPPGFLAMQAWQSVIAAYARQYGPREPIKGLVRLQMEFYRAWPKSAPKSSENAKKRFVDAHIIKRPDVDNYGKAARDAMNGICYLDDSQIVVMGPDIKGYNVDGPGYTIVTVEDLS